MSGTSISPLISDLMALVPGGVRADAPLSQLSRWKIGGPAAVLVEPSNAEQARQVMALMAGRSEPLFIMGDASNVLFDSEGFDGVVLRISQGMSKVRIEGRKVWSQAGSWVPHLARKVGSAGLSGMEHAIGIPGTLGGLILMNGGSQRKGIGLNVHRVLCADRRGEFVSLSKEECGFAYRTSTLQQGRLVVLEAELEFTLGDVHAIKEEMLAILMDRRRKFPKNLPNCGSTFLSDPSMYETVGPPGKAIELAGLKGIKLGGAQISPLHANFIVNLGGATSSDVLGLISFIRNSVHERTGYWMDCEVRYVSPGGDIQPAHIAADLNYSGSRIQSSILA